MKKFLKKEIRIYAIILILLAFNTYTLIKKAKEDFDIEKQLYLQSKSHSFAKGTSTIFNFYKSYINDIFYLVMQFDETEKFFEGESDKAIYKDLNFTGVDSLTFVRSDGLALDIIEPKGEKGIYKVLGTDAKGRKSIIRVTEDDMIFLFRIYVEAKGYIELGISVKEALSFVERKSEKEYFSIIEISQMSSLDEYYLFNKGDKYYYVIGLSQNEVYRNLVHNEENKEKIYKAIEKGEVVTLELLDGSDRYLVGLNFELSTSGFQNIFAVGEKDSFISSYYRGYKNHIVIRILLLTILLLLLLKLAKMHIDNKKMVYLDQLTGAYNRKVLTNIYDNEMINTVAILDIDNFKSVNDTYGHNEGDRVLQEIAKLVKGQLEEDNMFIRWGGEEFMIYYPNNKVEAKVEEVDRIRVLISEYDFTLQGRRITCSFGMVSNTANEGITELVAKADEKLYIAKKSGKNRVEL